jgi:glycosyltransferase involved in cell wall biosynthesis
MLIERLVSAIIPVHNRPALLREAVVSVLAQTYRPLEIIIVDDGSNDRTAREVNALAESYAEVRAIHRENGGPGTARETGRLAAHGEFIQYLDSDDLLLPTKFEIQVAGLREYKDCAVAYGKTRFYAVGEQPINAAYKRTGERILTMFPSFLQSRWWSTSTPLYRRAITDEVGSWTNLRNEEDWEYDCRVASRRVRLCYCDAFVSDTRSNAGTHLSDGGSNNPDKLRDRAAAHKLILEHALVGGLTHEAAEMQHFARELFLLSRQCGAVGLIEQARTLFKSAQQASGAVRSRGIDFRLYNAGARILGWGAMGALSCRLDRFRA